MSDGDVCVMHVWCMCDEFYTILILVSNKYNNSLIQTSLENTIRCPPEKSVASDVTYITEKLVLCYMTISVIVPLNSHNAEKKVKVLTCFLHFQAIGIDASVHALSGFLSLL
jgi:hypothetical protein